jgi:hypothetical protein
MMCTDGDVMNLNDPLSLCALKRWQDWNHLKFRLFRFLIQAKREEYWHNLRNSMIECSGNHEAFFKKLAHNPDGFGVVVEHFGRSIVA